MKIFHNCNQSSFKGIWYVRRLTQDSTGGRKPQRFTWHKRASWRTLTILTVLHRNASHPINPIVTAFQQARLQSSDLVVQASTMTVAWYEIVILLCFWSAESIMKASQKWEWLTAWSAWWCTATPHLLEMMASQSGHEPPSADPSKSSAHVRPAWIATQSGL